MNNKPLPWADLTDEQRLEETKVRITKYMREPEQYRHLLTKDINYLLTLAEAGLEAREALERMKKQNVCAFCNVKNQGRHSTLCPIEKALETFDSTISPLLNE